MTSMTFSIEDGHIKVSTVGEDLDTLSSIAATICLTPKFKLLFTIQQSMLKEGKDPEYTDSIARLVEYYSSVSEPVIPPHEYGK